MSTKVIGKPWPTATDKGQHMSNFEAYRSELMANLPELLSKATEEYRRFSMENVADDPKSFTTYQTGCRAALTHIQLLMKLADWVSDDGQSTSDQDDEYDIHELIAEAEGAIKYK